MRRTIARVTVWGAIAAGLIHTLSAQALGLGDISVDSLLNQRFSAVIPLNEIDSEDLETVSVSVAPADAYERAGVERVDFLDSLEFTVRNDRGQPRVVVSSNQIAREPVVNLLVQVRWAGGRLLREYTVLLDPPQLAPAPKSVAPTPIPPSAPAPVIAAPAAPKPVPPPAVAAPKPAAPPTPVPPPPKPESEFYETAGEGGKTASRPKPAPTAAPKPASIAPAPASGEFYGPVQPKETLWSIASKLRPGPDVSMDQVIYALAAANPKTIQRGTTVNKGATLAVPTVETITSLSAAEAKTKLAALRGTGGSAPDKPKATAPTPAKPAVEAPVAAPAVQTPPAPSAAPKPGKSLLDAPSSLAAAPKPAPMPAPAKPETKPEVKAEPKPAVKPEAKAEVAAPPPRPEAKPVAPAPPAPELKPEPSPAPKVEAAAPAAAPVPPPAAEAVAATPPSAAAPEAATAPPAIEPGAAAPPEPPPATEPSPAATPAPAPELAQAPPEDESGGLGQLLSDWGLPIGGLVVVLLIALLAVKKLGERAGGRSRRSGRSSGSKASSFAAGAAVGGAGAAKMGDTQVSPARALDSTQALEQTQAITQQITQKIDTESTGELKPSAFESTLVIEPDVAASLQTATRQSAVSQSKTDFDMTTQLQAETLHISLDADDPISEADFHLAYGLYDEAILLLKQAAAKAPDRLDLKVKLAETYFAAGKPIEFQTLAEELKPKLDAGEWSKIAIMGAQLCPNVTLFKGQDGAGLAADFDLGFDDEPVAAPAAPAPKPEEAPLAFELPDVSIPAASELMPPPAPPVPESFDELNANIKLQLEPELAAQSVPEEDPASIDFMLGQSITPIGAASDSPPPALDSNLLEFDLDSSLNKPVDPGKPLPGVIDDLDFQLSVSPSPPPALALDEASRDLKLEQFSVSLTPREVAPGTVTDEFNTKLDLARAYVEMGDNEMARGLLQEVQQQGNETQQREAGEMLQRLPA